MHRSVEKTAAHLTYVADVRTLPRKPVSAKKEKPNSARSRLISAARSLFSSRGYEQSSTAAIARGAQTSESQLVRYFGEKSGVLDAIFSESWAVVHNDIESALNDSPNGREAVLRIFLVVSQMFQTDAELATIFLFEGRRIRRGGTITISPGTKKFYELFCTMVERGQQDGSFRTDFPASAITSALIGVAEGMWRDRLVEERNAGTPVDLGTIVRAFTAASAAFASAEERSS